MPNNKTFLTLLLAGLVVVVTGCASPSPVPTLSPYDLAKPDIHRVAADATAAIQKLIDESNAKLAQRADLIFITGREYERHINIVPNNHVGPYRSDNGVIKKSWRDHFILVQQWQPQLKLGNVDRVGFGYGRALYEIDINVIATIRHRSLVIGEAKPVPTPPKGYKYGTVPFKAGFWGGCCSEIPNLPEIPLPDGVDSATFTDARVRDAEDQLRKIEIAEHHIVLNCVARYDPERRLWLIATMSPIELEYPPVLRWERGLPDDWITYIAGSRAGTPIEFK